MKIKVAYYEEIKPNMVFTSEVLDKPLGDIVNSGGQLYLVTMV